MQGLYKPLNLGLRAAADTLSLTDRYFNHRYLEHATDIALGIRAAGFLLPTILNISKMVALTGLLPKRFPSEKIFHALALVSTGMEIYKSWTEEE